MSQTPESQQQYGSILTVLGENAEQNGKLQNKQITFTHIAIGDANDTYVQPSRTQSALVNEVARIPVNSVDVLQPTPDSVPMLKVEALLPDNVNDLVIREFAAVATFDGNEYFHAIGNCARIYVPPPVNNGHVLTPVTLEMIFVITSADPIVEIDPNVITASRDWVHGATFVRKNSYILAQREASNGAIKDGAVVETLGFYNAYDGGGCRYEVKNNELQRIPEGPVTYKQFGAKGGGSVDAISSIIDAHAYANFHNLPVQGDGDTYLIAGAGCIDVKTDTNLGGSVFKLSRTGTAPWIKVSPSLGNEEKNLSQSFLDLIQPHLKSGKTYIPGIGNEHEALQSYVYLKTDKILTERVGYNHFVYAQDSFALLRDGNILGQLITDLSASSFTTAVYKPLENSTLTFENFNILLNFESAYVPQFLVERNQVDVKEFSVKRIAKNITIEHGVGTLFKVSRCYKVSFDTADGDSIGYGYYGLGQYGYMIQCENVVDLTINRLQANGGWGITGSNWLKDVLITNSQINRWDVHFGMGNTTIRDSSFYGYGVNVAYGDGQLLLDNVKLYPQYSVGTDGSELPFMSGWLVGSGASYGHWWKGSIIIKDVEVWIDPESDINDFKFIYAPSLNSDYTADGVLTIGTQWKVIRPKIRYMNKPPSDDKEMHFYGAYIGGAYSRKFKMPSSITVEEIDIDTSHKKTYLHALAVHSPPDWSDPEQVYQGVCEINIKGVKNQMADWDLMSCPDITEPNAETQNIQKYGLVRFDMGNHYGNSSIANSLCAFDISIDDCKGTFYDAYYNHEVSISNSTMLLPRVSDHDGGTRRLVDSEIWPLPHSNPANGLVCLMGLWITRSNTVKRSIRAGQAELSKINIAGLKCAMGNVIEKGGPHDDDSINMLWMTQSPNSSWQVPSYVAAVENTIFPPQ